MTREKVTTMFDAPKAPRTDLADIIVIDPAASHVHIAEFFQRPSTESFHERMVKHLGARTQLGRLAGALLRHVHEGSWAPNAATVAILVAADLQWTLPVLRREYAKYQKEIAT